MKLSERGFRKIKAYEGYGKSLPDGSCCAYQERINGKLDIPTIGYGCTKGVEMGQVWTRDQADAALKREIAGHETRVNRLATVELNQNEFDALVSFDYNTGGLAKSTILKRLNAGDREGAAKAFAAWNKFGGRPCKALIARRADEAALFLEPIDPAEPSTMPQAVEKAIELPSRKTITAVATTVAVAPAVLPAPPAAILEQATAWKGFANSAAELLTYAMSNPKPLAIIGVAGLAMFFGPRVAPRIFGRG